MPRFLLRFLFFVPVGALKESARKRGERLALYTIVLLSGEAQRRKHFTLCINQLFKSRYFVKFDLAVKSASDLRR